MLLSKFLPVKSRSKSSRFFHFFLPLSFHSEFTRIIIHSERISGAPIALAIPSDDIFTSLSLGTFRHFNVIIVDTDFTSRANIHSLPASPPRNFESSAPASFPLPRLCHASLKTTCTSVEPMCTFLKQYATSRNQPNERKIPLPPSESARERHRMVSGHTACV